ncbi:hypothetical protein DERP_010036 [Dermatophagoides pteronyssinus]|uniref:Uncharacterized protein n=1 Tax=Dermatophagoides pteronyssinus TaxID=6956 RepID=A0ABQ8JF77_DERPT|nr:hypothetical protein DERP_010036 [Dermatophagoides pteronyssinus]
MYTVSDSLDLVIYFSSLSSSSSSTTPFGKVGIIPFDCYDHHYYFLSLDDQSDITTTEFRLEMKKFNEKFKQQQKSYFISLIHCIK